MHFYEKFFDLPFPLGKMDMASIPDFSAGAMENWGLITYREALVLYNQEKSASTDKESVTDVIAHELAHQWFGDIVTMKWWTDLWLNEGFATHIQFKGVESVFPKFRFLDRQVIDATMKAFGVDAIDTSKALLATCTNPTYDLQFGTIAYQKGASILRMIEKFMPKGKFQEGVQQYLKDHIYANAESKDLWNALNAKYNGDATIAEIMDSWTKKPGFPVVTFDGQSLSQERFFFDTEGKNQIVLFILIVKSNNF